MGKGKFKFKSWMVVGLVIAGLVFVLWPMLKGGGIAENLGKSLTFRGTRWI